MGKAAFCVFSCLLACWWLPAGGQYYFYNSRYYDALFTVDAGVSAGGMNCLTDLGGKKETGRRFISDMDPGATRLCGGISTAVHYNNAIGIRLELATGAVSGSDSILKKYASATNGRYLRNLSFRSRITEISLAVELYPLSLLPDAGIALQPYALAGIGRFSFNPQAVWNNSWISLQPLHTEGQGFPEYPGQPVYKLTQFNLPFGGGIRYELSPILNIRGEIICRHLFTDYLDDVSTAYIHPSLFDRHLSPQAAALARTLADRSRGTGITDGGHEGEIRGSKKNNDVFFSVSLKCSFVMGRKRIK